MLGGRGYNGMFACFFHGLLCFLLAKTSRSLQILRRVVDGWMMSSTNPAHVQSVLVCERNGEFFAYLFTNLTLKSHSVPMHPNIMGPVPIRSLLTKGCIKDILKMPLVAVVCALRRDPLLHYLAPKKTKTMAFDIRTLISTAGWRFGTQPRQAVAGCHGNQERSLNWMALFCLQIGMQPLAILFF